MKKRTIKRNILSVLVVMIMLKLKCTLTAIINEKMKDYRFVLKFVD